jgi:hypothetical protein
MSRLLSRIFTGFGAVYDAVARALSIGKTTEAGGDRAGAQSLNAFAANPRVAFRPNPEGTPRRTIAQALTIARAADVDIDDEDFWFVESRARLGLGRYASYFDLDVSQSEGRTLMVELRQIVLDDGRFRVVVCPTTLESDDAIVGTFAHEVHEASALRARLVSNGGRLPAQAVYLLVNPQTGTLHCAAWDYADVLVKQRQTKP